MKLFKERSPRQDSSFQGWEVGLGQSCVLGGEWGSCWAIGPGLRHKTPEMCAERMNEFAAQPPSQLLWCSQKLCLEL